MLMPNNQNVLPIFVATRNFLFIDEVMDICVKIIFFKILTTLHSHNFCANYQNLHFQVFFLFFGIVYINFCQKNFRKLFLVNFEGPAKNVKIPLFVIF
jgi:hypothetical protein